MLSQKSHLSQDLDKNTSTHLGGRFCTHVRSTREFTLLNLSSHIMITDLALFIYRI